MEQVSLTTVAQGKAELLFQKELQAVLANIEDPTTEGKEARKIVLEFSIEPSEQRGMGVVTLRASSKLAKSGSGDEVIYFSRQGGRLAALREDPRQAALSFVSGSVSDETVSEEEHSPAC